jgi:peptide/nickel transport system ATP-binding protein
VAPGEIVALIGESGAGKTTIALAALGYTRPGTRVAAGSITLGGVDLAALGPRLRRAVRGRDAAYVAQSAQASLNPAIPIGDQVAEPLLLHGLAPPRHARERALALLGQLDLPSPQLLYGRYPHQASGGQQQRVMIAMAMSCSPRLIVFDEPTTALDVTTQIEVLKTIKDVIRTYGSSALYVSHNLAVVAQVADRVMVLKDGVIVEHGATRDIIERPRDVYTRRLIVAAQPPLRHQDQPTPSPQPRVLLNVAGVSASYARPPAFGALSREANVLDDVSFGLDAREVLAIVGESGSGKSTLARVVAGLHPPRAGKIAFEAKPLPPGIRGRDQSTLRRIQIIFQSPDLSLNPEQRIEEAIGRPLALYFGLAGSPRAARVAELLAAVDLPADFARRYPSELSGGQRQRVAIARAFAARPDVLLCDEILSSLDTVVAAQILELMQRLRASQDVAYLFISHDLLTVRAFADRVLVLYSGRVCEIGPAASVFGAAHHPYTALLLASVPTLQPGWLNEVLQSRPPSQAQASGGVPRDAGCPFRTRCPVAIPGRCDKIPPPERKPSASHVIYCHRELAELSAEITLIA